MLTIQYINIILDNLLKCLNIHYSPPPIVNTVLYLLLPVVVVASLLQQLGGGILLVRLSVQIYTKW